MVEFLTRWLPIIGLFIFVYALFVVLTMLIPRQWVETVGRPKDQFTKLRYIILRLLFYIVAALCVPLTYRLIRIFGGDSEILRAVASLSSAMVVLLFVQTLKAIFDYKYKK